jgi:2,3-bisphosphoglycerate-dependent phosphoglycerate mutase
MKKTTLCLVRHGETVWNADGRIQGQLDTELSATGRSQARAVADALRDRRFTAVYASDLVRVRDTAAPTCARLGMTPSLDPDLRERHYGIFQESTYPEAKERWPQDYARFAARDPEFGFVTGEKLIDFYRRSVDCVASIAERHQGETILVFTHGGVLEMVYRHANRLGLSSPRDFLLPNAGLNWVEADLDGWRVTTWADVRHLDTALDDANAN